MFKCNYKKLRLSFNEFHYFEDNDLPVDDEFCLLELKDGSLTAGKWWPFDEGETPAGEFIRGTADSITVDEVAKWHSLRRNDLSNCLEDERVNYIKLGEEKEGVYNIKLQDFKSLRDGDLPKKEQYCLLIMMDGRMAAGRWNQWRGENKGIFIYASALASYGMDKVWAWTPLSSDRFFAAQEELENEIKREEELNRNPSIDQEKFIYGIDIDAYYKKALEKLKKDYPWATLNQMKKREPFEITPLHGRYVFGRVGKSFYDVRTVNEWTEGSSFRCSWFWAPFKMVSGRWSGRIRRAGGLSPGPVNDVYNLLFFRQGLFAVADPARVHALFGYLQDDDDQDHQRGDDEGENVVNAHCVIPSFH